MYVIVTKMVPLRQWALFGYNNSNLLQVKSTLASEVTWECVSCSVSANQGTAFLDAVLSQMRLCILSTLELLITLPMILAQSIDKKN